MALSPEDQRKLIEAQVTISDSLKGIKDTLNVINDQNILHNTKLSAEHQSLKEKIMLMTAKYWWLIMILVFALIVLAGAEKVFKYVGI